MDNTSKSNNFTQEDFNKEAERKYQKIKKKASEMLKKIPLYSKVQWVCYFLAWVIKKFKIFLLDRKGFNYPLYFALFLFALLGFMDYFNWAPDFLSFLRSFSFIESSIDLILYLTLLAIISYSVETYRLRSETYRMVEETRIANELSSKIKDEMAMTNKLSIQPGLIAEYIRENGGPWQLRLYNVGNGAALDVDIKSHLSDYDFIPEKRTIPAGEAVMVNVWHLSKTVDTFEIFSNKPASITVLFNRIKRLDKPLTTEAEIRMPPCIITKKQDWRIRVN